MTADEPPTPEEEAAARALARLLAGEPDGVAPADIAPTLALLEHSHEGASLSPEREEVVRLRILRVRQLRAPRLWLVSASAVAAAAAVALVVWRQDYVSATPVPSPNADLLQAEAAAIAGKPSGLDSAMRDYRGDVYRALQTRYRGQE